MSDIDSRMNARMQQRTGLLRMRSNAARAETRGEIEPVMVPLEQITIDEDIQVRVAGLDAEKVAQYAVVFEEGGEFPPVVVFRDQETNELYLADGFHRVAAAEKAGLAEIEAEVRPDGREAAIEYAEEANLAHGFALTTRDKRYIFERRIKRGHEWATWSDGAIARALGVDRKTVGNWRRQLETTGEISPVTGPRVGADGRVYEVDHVQEENRRRAEERRKAQRVEYVRDPAIDQTVGAWDEPAIEYEEPEPPFLPGEAALHEAHGMTPRGRETVAGEGDARPVDPTIRRAIIEALSHIERYHRPLLVEHVARQCGVNVRVAAETLRALETQGVVERQGLAVRLVERPAIRGERDLPQDGDTAVTPVPEIAEVLQEFAGLCVTLSRHLENVRDGYQVIPPEYEDGVLDQVVEALDYLNGYEAPQGRWIVGIVDLLETVRRDLEEADDEPGE